METEKKRRFPLIVGLVIVAAVIVIAFAVIMLWRAPRAKFEVSSLNVSPAEAFVGETVTISAEVKNVGNAEGVYKASLVVDEVEVETEDVSLSEGETKTLTFTMVKDTDGNFTIKVGELTTTLPVERCGLCPTLHMGDQWVTRVSDDTIYTWTLEVTAIETITGKECYVFDISFTPPVEGFIDTATGWCDTATMDMIRMQMSGEYMGFPYIASTTTSYNYSDDMWPLEVGKECDVVATTTFSYTVLGNTTTETETETYTVEVESREEITVPAGTFMCFKIVEYAENGDIISTWWYSDRTKMEIKSINLEANETIELKSYIVS